MTVLDYSKKLEQLFREAYLLKKDQIIKLRGVLWTWHVRGRQGWQLLVMQDVIRDEVGKVHACFAMKEMSNVITAGCVSWDKNSKSTAFLLLLRQALWL